VIYVRSALVLKPKVMRRAAGILRDG
jgi:hypothetical protein